MARKKVANSDEHGPRISTYEQQLLRGPHAVSRLAWERQNANLFTDDFADTQERGATRFGMRFVQAQQAAMAAGYGGIFAKFDYADPAERAKLSRIVLAVMTEVLT